MSSHADTIRVVLDWPIAYYNEEQEQLARKALDALLAENQRLREALERIAQNTTRSTSSGDTYPSQSALIAREALAGDAE